MADVAGIYREVPYHERRVSCRICKVTYAQYEVLGKKVCHFCIAQHIIPALLQSGYARRSAQQIIVEKGV